MRRGVPGSGSCMDRRRETTRSDLVGCPRRAWRVGRREDPLRRPRLALLEAGRHPRGRATRPAAAPRSRAPSPAPTPVHGTSTPRTIGAPLGHSRPAIQRWIPGLDPTRKRSEFRGSEGFRGTIRDGRDLAETRTRRSFPFTFRTFLQRTVSIFSLDGMLRTENRGLGRACTRLIGGSSGRAGAIVALVLSTCAGSLPDVRRWSDQRERPIAKMLAAGPRAPRCRAPEGEQSLQ